MYPSSLLMLIFLILLQGTTSYTSPQQLPHRLPHLIRSPNNNCLTRTNKALQSTKPLTYKHSKLFYKVSHIPTSYSSISQSLNFQKRSGSGGNALQNEYVTSKNSGVEGRRISNVDDYYIVSYEVEKEVNRGSRSRLSFISPSSSSSSSSSGFGSKNIGKDLLNDYNSVARLEGSALMEELEASQSSSSTVNDIPNVQNSIGDQVETLISHVVGLYTNKEEVSRLKSAMC